MSGWRRGGGDEDAAGLGLPPGIDDRAALVADDPIVPFPGLGVDRLADRAEHAQGLPRGCLHRLLAGAHQRADRRRGGVEDIDLVLVDHLPEPRDRRVGRDALEHQGGGAVRQRPVQDVGMPGDPADIGGAPVDVALVVVEDVLMRHRRVDEVAAGGVDDALRLAGRTRGVEQEQRVLGLDMGDRAFVGDLGGGCVVIDVADRVHLDGAAGAAHHDHVVDAVGRKALDRRVDIGLQRHLAAAAQALVGGDDELRVAALDAAGQRIRREAAEHHRVDRAEPGAGQHGVGGFRDHRQVDGDPVALGDAAVAQDVGHPAHLRMQLAVGDMARFRRIVALPDDRDLVAAGLEVAVDAIVGGVGDAVGEPLDRDVAGAERRLLHLGIGGEPVDPLAVLAPERLRITDRGLVPGLILGLVDMRPRPRILADLDDPLVHGAPPLYALPGRGPVGCSRFRRRLAAPATAHSV